MPVMQPPPIGRNIMNERKKRNMSLDELSKKSGVSKSMLSQIEQAKTNPTVITAWKIARALNIDIQQLITSYDNSIIEVIRNQDSPVIYSKDQLCTIRINTPIHMADNLEIYSMTFMPGGKLASMPHYPGSEEFLTIISGKIKVTAGNKSTLLDVGDTARYRADVEHIIENVGDTKAEAHLVVYFPK